ncbi:DNA polymerase III subunit gamma/tau [Clostridium botulinum]|uniref:DNA-directed DNA polymerase n=2 Tax=Clostridium botulinum TaxID=1491 RepID=A5HXS6_CLOBH|nr:DNA polymerase III subunit gamma/tau [Clostridium botulinum]EKN40308.1 DNA polymerase III subunits gamma and tau [Clostridium botulinum CFSAN001627]ABS34519.1 DNA polymerase III, gamma and tau subunit [Clostridium botulinum A str. ATCC 19397]ABS36728.1 DNA polymerase III, gamma and tau subunit [Clostridium botulinum A str. Hall]APQ71912.1 DNA polymerase III, subunit gamma and tau [Clostridium botulinum]APQ95289.1 DNA polymerase III, subunit gamma and tau [Clostridium botulinum]
MGYTALYREWRPRTFKEVVGQKHITVTLKNQVIEKRIAHAYLFCGTRGTGKTSTAKILSKAVNCLNPKDGEPCNECEICNKINSGTLMDVIEMDAASKRKLEDIKEVIENVKYPPQEGKNKVYIMDEVHMLTQEAVNAFLKTLEEPPSNVIFILATTDPQKLPITILSRCQRFDFRRIRNEEIFERLRAIVSEQGIYADDKSLNLIARMSDGAMRDALSILDQVISTGDGKVEYDQVLDMLGLVTNENLLRITNSIIEKDVEKSMRIIEDIVLSGKDIYNFIKDMITHLRNILMVKVSKNPNEILDMSSENIDLVKEQSEKIRIEEIMRNIKILQEAEQQSKWVKQNRIYLELAVLKMCKIEYDTSKEVILSRLNKIEELIKSGNIKLAINEEKKKIEPKEFNLKREKESMQHSKIEKNSLEDYNKDSKLTVETVKKMWHDILEAFKARRLMVLYAALVTANITDCKEGIITLNYNKQYSFNKKRLEKPENNKVVQEIFSEVLKEKIRIIYIVEEKAKEENLPEEILKNTFGENILEIIDE